MSPLLFHRSCTTDRFHRHESLSLRWFDELLPDSEACAERMFHARFSGGFVRFKCGNFRVTRFNLFRCIH